MKLNLVPLNQFWEASENIPVRVIYFFFLFKVLYQYNSSSVKSSKFPFSSQKDGGRTLVFPENNGINEF